MLKNEKNRVKWLYRNSIVIYEANHKFIIFFFELGELGAFSCVLIYDLIICPINALLSLN